MAARSVTVTLVNNSRARLVRTGGSLSHGVWDTEPPTQIDPGTSTTWESESDGVATGTEGEVYYDIDTIGGQKLGQAHFHWDDPFIGSNSYDAATPPTYWATRSGGDGNNASVTWVFDETSTSGDGIPDDWKRNGVTIDPGDGSGPQFIDLPSMGADVNKADIFVQLDWMADSTHNHQLSAAAIKTVVDAFANSPFVGRNGVTGINLHVDAGPDSIMNFATNQTWGSLSRAQQQAEVANLGTATANADGSITYDWTAFNAIRDAKGGFTSSGRAQIFHYCLAANQIGTVTNSGIAAGSDFIVSLGGFTPPITDQQMAGTFMHELGHNLGLGHGGGDSINNKPNYVSVMNYLWQLIGLTRGGTADIVDYSRAAMKTINEASLDEPSGLGPNASGIAIQHWVPATPFAPGQFVQVADGSGPIDWNGDGDTTDTGVSVDTNHDGTTGPLSGYDDWGNLQLIGGSIGAGAGENTPPTITTSEPEMTPSDLARVARPDTTPPVTTAAVWPAPNVNGWNRTDVEVTLSATDDISGVACTVYALDGIGPIIATGPITISAEGLHTLTYHSIDRSQNVEADHELTIKIDKTAPEFVISYDWDSDQILVSGRDGLSGVDPGPVAPAFEGPTQWTRFGSDVAERRIYEIVDHADNRSALVMKVRCGAREWEASVLAVRYDDHARQQGQALGAYLPEDRLAVEDSWIDEQCGHTQTDQAPSDRAQRWQRTPRNTIIYERVVGRGAARPVLLVNQIVSIGDGDGRTTVRTRYDALDDLSLVSNETGSQCYCADSVATATNDIRGLVAVRVATHRANLQIEQ